MAELEAIVADYLQQAAAWDAIPAAGRCACSRPRGARAMTGRATPIRSARQFSERDLLIATLVGRYVERRERGDAPCAHDLLAVAAEHGDSAVDGAARRPGLLRGDARHRPGRLTGRPTTDEPASLSTT